VRTLETHRPEVITQRPTFRYHEDEDEDYEEEMFLPDGKIFNRKGNQVQKEEFIESRAAKQLGDFWPLVLFLALTL